MPKPVVKSVLEIGPEATAGTVAATLIAVPVTNIAAKNTVTQLVDKGWRGSAVDSYDVVAGMITAEVDFDGDVFLDTIGYVLAGMFGDVQETGSSAPYTHTFNLLNSGTTQPLTHTILDYYAAGTRTYSSARYSELDFKFSPDALLTYSAKAMSFGGVTGTAPTPSYTSVEVLPAWTGVVKIGGSAYAEMTDAEINVKRSVTAIKTINNSQTPYAIFAGVMTVEGKATLVMEDDTYLNEYLNATKTTLDFTFTQSVGNSIEFNLAKANLTAADVQRGKEYVELPISFKAYGNSTNVGTSAGYGPLTVTLTNSVATGLYNVGH
jgi:hypothetical protein